MRSKVASEQSIGELADDNFSPVFFRNGTVYGVSPRMRFDTVLNNLAGGAFTTGVVTVLGDGSPWRPVVHVDDVARAFQAVLEAPAADVHNQAFNTGAEHLNQQIVELAHIVAGIVPDCEVNVLGSRDADQRTYRADFSKFALTFPAFEFRWTRANRCPRAHRDLCPYRPHARRFHGPEIHPPGVAEATSVPRRSRWILAVGSSREGGPMIDGVKLVPLRQIVDERGKIMHMLKSTDEHFLSFGEIYFSCAWPGHDQGLACASVHDDQQRRDLGSGQVGALRPPGKLAHEGELQEIFLGEDNYVLAQIPPGIANGYKAYGDSMVILANAADGAS